MSGKNYAVDLPAPGRGQLSLPRLLGALDAPARRRMLDRLLADPIEEQGMREHHRSEFEHAAESEHVTRHLHELRYAGWVHQRPGRTGLLTRLRRHDLDQRLPGLLSLLDPRDGDLSWVSVWDGLRERRRIDAAVRALLDG